MIKKHGKRGSKKTMGKREQLADRRSDDLLFADSYNDTIAGMAIGFDGENIVYDVEKMIRMEKCNG